MSDAGFEVVSLHTESAALFEIQLGLCGVLLLCHKLGQSTRENLARDFEKRCPDPYIIAFLAKSNDPFPPQAHKLLVHSLDPTPLIGALKEKLAAGEPH